MSFIVNGMDWEFNGQTTDQINEKIESALNFISSSESRGEKTLIGDDFLTRHMVTGCTLFELGLPGEIVQELSAWLGRDPRYLNENSWPEGYENDEISINGEAAVKNFDVAWVHHSVRNNIPVGCFSFALAGRIGTTSESGSTEVHFLNDEEGRTVFWQDAIIIEGDNVGSLIKRASQAYPNLFFFENVLNSISNLSGGYFAAREPIQKFLSVLNEHSEWIFCHPPPNTSIQDETPENATGNPDNSLIERRFRGLGFIVAPEKPNVRADTKCRTAREIILNDSTFYCEWHLKLEPHRNRIHIHPPTPVSDNKTIIAIIHEHLPLP